MAFEVYKRTRQGCGTGRRPSFDHEKTVALFHAGQSVPQIAADVGSDPKLVRQVLYRRGLRIRDFGRVKPQ